MSIHAKPKIYCESARIRTSLTERTGENLMSQFTGRSVSHGITPGAQEDLRALLVQLLAKQLQLLRYTVAIFERKCKTHHSSLGLSRRWLLWSRRFLCQSSSTSRAERRRTLMINYVNCAFSEDVMALVIKMSLCQLFPGGYSVD